LRIEGTEGSLITSIRFRNDTEQDFLVFDRFAVFATPSHAVPEPGSLLIFGLGGLGQVARRWLRGKGLFLLRFGFHRTPTWTQ